MTTKQSKSGQLALRVEPELRAALQAAAERERRPMSSLIRCVLSDWVDGRGERGESAAGVASG